MRHGALRVESLAQVDDEAVPLLLGQLTIEIDGQTYSDRKSHELARCRLWLQLNRLRGAGQLIGRDPDLAPDILELNEGHPLAEGNERLTGMLRLGGTLEDRSHLSVVKSSLGHVSNSLLIRTPN